jgi:uncharacterized repeat protein (TIGR03843 family)
MDDDRTATARRLAAAPLELLGRFADASNATLLVRLLDRDPRPIAALAADLGRTPEVADLPPEDLAVYKPRRGEAPLWDFPTGTLHRREVAAFLVSDELDWGIVPTTVLRSDGPAGTGSLQRFVPHDPQEHYFTLAAAAERDAALRSQLVTMALFDLVIDNADRKGGHVLLEQAPDDRRVRPTRRSGPAVPRRIQGVDHGVSFNLAPKLRTVIWDFVGAPVPAARRHDLERLDAALTGGLGDELVRLLSRGEVEVLRARVATLAELETLPAPASAHPYPWPLL